MKLKKKLKKKMKEKKEINEIKNKIIQNNKNIMNKNYNIYKGNLEKVIKPLPNGTFPENSVLYW